MPARGKKTERLAYIGLGTALAALLLVAAVSYWSIFGLREDFLWVSHTQEVLRHLAGALGHLADAEAGQRAYVITGQERYLEPYHLAESLFMGGKTAPHIAALRELTKDNPAQQERMGTLERLSRERLAGLAKTIALRREKGPEVAQARILTDVGKRIMDDIRRVIAEMSEEEQRLLRRRQSQQAARMRFVFIVMGAVLLMIPLISAFVIWEIKRDVTRRKQAEEHMRREKDRAERYLNIAGVMLVTVDIDENITLINKKGCEILGYGKGELIGRNCFDTLVPQRVRDEVRGVFRRLMAGDVAPVEYHENPLLRKDGEERIISFHNAIIKDARGQISGALVSAEDITDRKLADEALRESEEKYRTLVETAQEGLGIVDPDENILFCNRAYGRLLGYETEELIGLNLQHLTVPEEFAKYREQTQKRKGGEASQYETVLYTKAGDAKSFSLSASPLCDDAGTFIGTLGLITDITDRKRAEEERRTYQQQLRALASGLVRTEAEERRRLGAFLHDVIAQKLALAKIRLDELGDSAASTDLTDGLAEVSRLVSEAVRDSRSVMVDLSPPVLYELGFVAAAEWLTEKFEFEHGVAAEFADDGRPKTLADDVRTVLFRSLQELLVNVARHAKARHVKVAIAGDTSNIRVVVQDDGVGFKPDEVHVREDLSRGFGLFNIREILDYLGGRADIRSEPGCGTRATLIAPLQREAATGPETAQ